VEQRETGATQIYGFTISTVVSTCFFYKMSSALGGNESESNESVILVTADDDASNSGREPAGPCGDDVEETNIR